MNPPAKTRVFPPAAAAGRLAEVFVTHQGEGPHVGRRQLFVRLAGCEVGCRFCDTPDALRAGGAFEVRRAGRAVERRKNPVGAAEMAALLCAIWDEDEAGTLHAIAVTGGEPLEQAPFLAELLPRLAPRPVLLETAGLHADELLLVRDHVAIVSMDWKLPSVAGTRADPARHREFLENARGGGREVYVKAVVSERLDPAELDAAAAALAARAPDVVFVVQPETRRDGTLTLDHAALAALAARAERAGLRDVRVLPQVHKYLRAP